MVVQWRTFCLIDYSSLLFFCCCFLLLSDGGIYASRVLISVHLDGCCRYFNTRPWEKDLTLKTGCAWSSPPLTFVLSFQLPCVAKVELSMCFLIRYYQTCSSCVWLSHICKDQEQNAFQDCHAFLRGNSNNCCVLNFKFARWWGW